MSANSVTVTKGVSEDFQMSYGVFNVSIGHEEVIIKVPETLILQVNTATSSYRTTEIKDIIRTLNFKNANSVPSNDYFALWHFSGLQTVTNLGIEIIGPATVSFFVSNTSPHLVEQLSGTVNLFGVIRSINNSIFSEVKQVPAKRKIDDVLMKKEKEVKEEQVSAPVLNKESRLKARRKMAKQKQKELTEALNKINGKGDQQSESHPEKENEKEFVPTNTSPMSERRLADGIIVKDIIIGGGAMVKSGRKCSILYTGKLRDGKIFDKKLVTISVFFDKHVRG